MDILNNLNLCGNQIQNVVLHPSATVPTAKAGAIYFDTSTGVNAVKVYDSSASLWRALLDGRDGCVTNSMISSLATGLQVGGVDVFVASGNDARAHIPTTGAVYDFVTDAFKKNDAMVYMGTFAAQATSGVTLTKSMFTLTGGGNPDNLTTFMSKGYTFKVTGNGYFGTIKVEAGDVIIVGKDSPSTTVSNYDIIQMNLTDYVTTFGGATGAISLPAAQTDTDSNVGVNLSMSGNTLTATLLCDKPVVAWSGGTSNGPTLTVKAMGKTSAAKAIPAAAVDASGVVTTEPQTFAGNKTFAGVVKTNDSFVISSPLTGVTTDSSSDLAIRKQAYTINGNSIEAWQIRPLGDQNLRPLHIGGGSVIGLFYTGKKNYSGTTLENAWGIGTLDPQYKLHVNGTFGAGASIFSGNVTIGSRILFAHSSSNIDLPYFEIVNVGTAASPVYAIHTNVGFYSDSFITSGGLGQSGGASGGSGMEHVYKYSDLTGSNAFDVDSDDDTFNAYAIKQMWLEASGAISNSITQLNPSGSGDVVTGVTKSGNAITVTKGKVTHLSLGASIASNASVNSMIGSGGLEVFNLSGCTDAPTSYGSMIQWSRGVGGTGQSVNTASQFFVPHQSNKLYFRNSWATGHNPGATGVASEWQDWTEVITDKNIGSKFSKSYTVKRSLASGNGSWTATSGSTAYMEYNSPDAFSTKNIVAALYDSSDCQVMTDVSIVAKTTTSGGDTITTYYVRLNFASAIGSSSTYRLVIFGQ